MGELRDFFADEHVHAALLVDTGTLIGVVERTDLAPQLSSDLAARAVATLDGRTVRPSASAHRALEAMKRANRRRLAVVSTNGRLLGLLCLKSNGRGFCSDEDIRSRTCADETAGP